MLAGCMSATTAAAGPLQVACSTTDLAAITQAVGGDAVQTFAIAQGPQDPHHVQARPSTMRRLNKMDLLVYNGLQLEIGWLPLLIQGARNPRIADAVTGQLDASFAIQALEVSAVTTDRSMGDIHPEGNPHYTLDPRNAARVAELVGQRIIELAPDQAVHVRANVRLFLEELTSRRQAWEGRLATQRGRAVVSDHKQFEYLADWLGLKVVAYLEDRPGIPPSPRHLSAVMERMQADSIDIVLTSTFSEPGRAQRFAERTGARVVTLPAAVNAIAGTADYLQLMDAIVERLATAFGGPAHGE